MKEIWKDIKGYEGIYQVSSEGRVRSLDRVEDRGRNIKGKILKPSINPYGYCVVGLFKNGTQKKNMVHRLVAEAFIPNPDNKPEIDHINTIKIDNTVFLNEDGSVNYDKTNLRWVTKKENMNNPLTKTKMQINARKRSKGKYGKENPASKPIIQYDKDSNFIKEWNCITDVERKMGYSVSNISSCLRGKSNTAYGYIWKYKNAV